MIDLITLEEAKAHLRETSSNADFDIEQKIFTASAILFDYLKLDPDASPLSVPWGLENETPGVIKAAVLLMTGELRKNPEAGAANVLSQAVKDLVHRYRDPGNGMSTALDIREVHQQESRFKLRPHLAPKVEHSGQLRVRLAELLGEDTIQILKRLGLLA